MRYFTWCASLLGIALFLTIAAAPAQAVNTRTWVSAVGNDADGCTRSAPCQTFAGALSKTVAGGEINCIDSGGFGAVTITKSISIICDVGTAGVQVSGTNGITVNVASTDIVVLRGLDIQGLGQGIDGVKIIGAGQTVISKCIIQGFSNNGVNSNGLNGARVTIDDSLILKNGIGLTVAGQAAVTNIGFVRNSLIDSNTTYSVNPATGSTIVLIGSTLSGTGISINNGAGGALVSYGNNFMRGTGAPTQTLMPQ